MNGQAIASRHTEKQVLRGYKQKRTSRFMDHEALMDAALTLGSGQEVKRLFDLFCVPPMQTRLELRHSLLPEFFCSLRPVEKVLRLEKT